MCKFFYTEAYQANRHDLYFRQNRASQGAKHEATHLLAKLLSNIISDWSEQPASLDF
jgi:hypothetical protein